MKIVERCDILVKRSFSASRAWEKACDDVERAIKATDWPHGSGKFNIYPESGKGSGVLLIEQPRTDVRGFLKGKLRLSDSVGTHSIHGLTSGDLRWYFKEPCIKKLKEFGWETEKLPKIEGGVLGTGDLDALYRSEEGFIGFEWETGNISSSHRAINKLLLTLLKGGIKGGILVVPSDKLKPYLTDRIGNIGELRPYFPLWTIIPTQDGALRIIVVEHDATSLNVPRIPKGTNGWASLDFHGRGFA